MFEVFRQLFGGYCLDSTRVYSHKVSGTKRVKVSLYDLLNSVLLEACFRAM
jgi:hypothetical protein